MDRGFHGHECITVQRRGKVEGWWDALPVPSQGTAGSPRLKKVPATVIPRPRMMTNRTTMYLMNFRSMASFSPWLMSGNRDCACVGPMGAEPAGGAFIRARGDGVKAGARLFILAPGGGGGGGGGVKSCLGIEHVSPFVFDAQLGGFRGAQPFRPFVDHRYPFGALHSFG